MECKSELGCDPKFSRRMYTAWQSKREGCWVPSVHADCNHNEIAALLLRSLGPTPDSVESARAPVLEVFRHLRMVSRRYSGSRWSYLETAHSYTGAMRRRYVEAEVSLREDGPLGSSDCLLRAFVKAEKVNTLHKFPKPRLIFPRSPRYNLVLASWLKPFEHWLWGNLKSWGVFNVPSTRVVAKGLNQRQRANLIRRKMSAIPDCVVLEIDAKAFEAHCDVWQLVEEHACYRSAYPGQGALANVLKQQLANFGVTKGGVKFSREGGRASGDFNTGMGNSLVMLAVTVATCVELGLSQFDTLVDGDNALLFLRPDEQNLAVDNFFDTALRISGHEIVLERPTTLLEEVRFGQSAPVCVSGNWTMLRDWRKVLSHGTSSHVHMSELSYVLPWLRGVAKCELSLAGGVPIVQKWAESILESTAGSRELSFDNYRDYQVLGVTAEMYGSAVGKEITLETRESFARAFGTPVDVQLEIEESMGRMPVLSDWCPEDAPGWDDWWDARPGLCEYFFS